MITFWGFGLSIGLGAALIGWEYASNGYPPAGLALALIGILWLILQSKWRWVNTAGFAILLAAAAGGIILRFSFPFLFAGSVLILIGWDLSEYLTRARFAAKEDDPTRLELAHLARLAIVLGVGVGIAILSQAFTLELTFEWSAFLLVSGTLGASLLIQKLWRREE